MIVPEKGTERNQKELIKNTVEYQRIPLRTNQNSPRLTASEKNLVTESHQKPPKATAPKFSKGQQVWFCNGVQWLQGTIERVITGVRNEYNVLDSRGLGLFVLGLEGGFKQKVSVIEKKLSERLV